MRLAHRLFCCRDTRLWGLRLAFGGALCAAHADGLAAGARRLRADTIALIEAAYARAQALAATGSGGGQSDAGELAEAQGELGLLPPSETAAFADLIKASSDRGVATTLVLVGVAEDIDTLLGSHASVVRNLRQVNLPRMSDGDLSEIVDEGLASAGFSIEETTRFRVVSVSQGFPHFTHLLAQNAARAALDDGRRKIEDADVAAGMAQAVERSDQSIRDAYYKAATGVRKNNLWPEVIAACALAESDERGYFATRAVQDAIEWSDRPARCSAEGRVSPR